MRTFVSREMRIMPELSAVSSCPVSILCVVIDISALRDCFGVSAHASLICALTYLTQLVDGTQVDERVFYLEFISDCAKITVKWNNNTASPRVVVRTLISDMSRVHNKTQLLQHCSQQRVQTMEFLFSSRLFETLSFQLESGARCQGLDRSVDCHAYTGSKHMHMDKWSVCNEFAIPHYGKKPGCVSFWSLL